MEPTDELDDADVVVLNTCCIRENADNKLYGHLGQLKALKDAPPRPPDRGRRVPGPEGPRAGPASGAGHVDVVFGTHNLAHAPPSCSHGPARDGPDRRDPRGARGVSRRRCRPAASVDHSAWVTIQIGCDNSCAFCIVPIVRGPRDQPPHGRHRRTRSSSSPPTASSRSRCSARTSTPTAATSAPASTGPLFADLLRGRRRGRRHRPRSASRRRTRRTCGPRRSRRWPSAPSVCEHLHLPLQSGSDRMLAAHAPRLHRRALPATGWPRPAPRSPDLAVTTDIIVGFPGETDDDFERTLEVVDEAALRRRLHVRVLAPPRHRGRRRWSTTSSPPRSSQERMRAAHRRGRAARAAPSTRRGSVAIEEVLRRGPVEERDPRCGRAAPARTSWCTSRRRRSPTVRAGECSCAHVASITYAGAALAARRPRRRRRPRRAGAASASRSRPRLRDPHHLALVGPTASGKSALALAVARALGDVEIVSVDSMQVYRGLDIGTAKPTVAERAEVAAPPDRRRRPDEEWSVAPVPGRGPRRGRRHRGAWPAGAARRRHRALRAGGGRRPSTFPPEDRAVRDADRSTPTSTPPTAYAELRAARPRCRGAHRARATRAASCARSR